MADRKRKAVFYDPVTGEITFGWIIWNGGYYYVTEKDGKYTSLQEVDGEYTPLTGKRCNRRRADRTAKRNYTLLLR